MALMCQSILPLDRESDQVRRFGIMRQVADAMNESFRLEWIGHGLTSILNGDIADAHWSFWMAELAGRPIE